MRKLLKFCDNGFFVVVVGGGTNRMCVSNDRIFVLEQREEGRKTNSPSKVFKQPLVFLMMVTLSPSVDGRVSVI